MASSTAEVVASIGKMQKQCSQIQYGSDQFGRKEYDPAVANPLAQVAIQMKLLMDAPEQLWSALEEKNFFSAAQVGAAWGRTSSACWPFARCSVPSPNLVRACPACADHPM